MFALFLALGPGRRQVFNELFSFLARSLARQRCSGWCGARPVDRGRWGEKSAERGAEGVEGRGGVKGSAGEGRTLGARRLHMAPTQGA